VKKPKPDYRAILPTLAAHQVEFIVVGGVAAVLEGAPVATFDLDVVHSRQPENVQRLLAALEELEARHRMPGKENAKPEPSHLLSPGHQLLMTRSGPLDLIGPIGAGGGYSELIRETSERDLGGGLRVRVLGLPAQNRIKQELARDRDLAVLAILRRTLEEKGKGS
jgi:hypothetical protein